MARIDLTNKEYGRWCVINFSHSVYKGNSKVGYWNCRCQCGTVKTVSGATLRNGTSISCGKCGTKSDNRKRHGMSFTPEYTAWAHMIQRCGNPNNPSYADYGERGILVCDKWQSFEGFFADMGLRPSNRHSLERTNNNLGYSKSNCVWATNDIQTRNTRRNISITWNGKTQVVHDWAVEMGVNSHSLSSRLRRGWTIERTMTTPF
jgi:transcription elongation factor Elf1